jgi:hypothetical protein
MITLILTLPDITLLEGGCSCSSHILWSMPASPVDHRTVTHVTHVCMYITASSWWQVCTHYVMHTSTGITPYIIPPPH